MGGHPQGHRQGCLSRWWCISHHPTWRLTSSQRFVWDIHAAAIAQLHCWVLSKSSWPPAHRFGHSPSLQVTDFGSSMVTVRSKSALLIVLIPNMTPIRHLYLRLASFQFALNIFLDCCAVFAYSPLRSAVLRGSHSALRELQQHSIICSFCPIKVIIAYAHAWSPHISPLISALF